MAVIGIAIIVVLLIAFVVTALDGSKTNKLWEDLEGDENEEND